MTLGMHGGRTASGIEIPDPDQGTPHIVMTTPPVGQIDVWWPFEDGTEGGHNLLGFLEVWAHFKAGSAPYLLVWEPRFGLPGAIDRAAIEKIGWIGLGYRRREDTRAGLRSDIWLPGSGARQVANGHTDMRVTR